MAFKVADIHRGESRGSVTIVNIPCKNPECQKEISVKPYATPVLCPYCGMQQGVRWNKRGQEKKTQERGKKRGKSKTT